LFACCVFSVHVSAPYSKILRTKAWYMSFLVLWRIVLLHKTEFNMPITMWDFKFSRRRVWSELSSGMYCRVKWLSTYMAVHPRRQFWTMPITLPPSIWEITPY
jgi:hypothetical protein